MKRRLEKELIAWKNDKNHMPILLRGARQVGKSYLVEEFGRNYFKNSVTVNFEFRPEFKECFNDFDPIKINRLLSALAGENIMPGETLLFFDEVQECPAAIQALRYYKEKLPEQHVIAAGSLLEFVLNDESFRMPVGRIQYLYLKPLSFKEFLQASKEENLIEQIESATFKMPIPSVVHLRLLGLLRDYLVLGGMPAVLSEYFDSDNLVRCQNIQSALLGAYQNDFGKYAKKTDYKYLQKLFEKAPGLVGKQFKYVSVDREMRSRDLKLALEQLCSAGIIFPVYATQASGVPLNTLKNEKRFKLLFLDVGLIKRASNIDAEILLNENPMLVNQGVVVEQYVGQELMAYQNPYENASLFYWEREKKSSQAEVDYVVNIGARVVPIEVKSGKTGRLKSLQQFMVEKRSDFGVRISQLPLSCRGEIMSIPLYMVSELERLTKNVCDFGG